MDFPKRGPTHKIESESWRIFTRDAPANWIVRQATERDYGVDAYVELVDNEDQVSGEIFFVQLKGTGQIEWSEDATAHFPGIAKSTVNYWLGLPVPVFLLVSDLKTSAAYFAPVHHAVRHRYEEFTKHETVGFPLQRKDKIGEAEGTVRFLVRYFQQKNFSTFENYVRDLLMHWEQYRDFILGNQNRDVFLEVEEERQLVLQHLWRMLRFFSSYCDVEWEVIGLAELYRRDHERWKDSYCRLHEESLDDVLAQIQKIYPSIVRQIAANIACDNGSYWRITNPIVFRLAFQLAHQNFSDME